MKMQRIGFTIAIINFLLMTTKITKINPLVVQKDQNKLQILRGSGLEIVDRFGKIRTRMEAVMGLYKKTV